MGIRVNKLGNGSVNYGVSIFKEDESEAAAFGEFIHVFVNRVENKSSPIPSRIRKALEKLFIWTLKSTSV